MQCLASICLVRFLSLLLCLYSAWTYLACIRCSAMTPCHHTRNPTTLRPWYLTKMFCYVPHLLERFCKDARVDEVVEGFWPFLSAIKLLSPFWKLADKGFPYSILRISWRRRKTHFKTNTTQDSLLVDNIRKHTLHHCHLMSPLTNHSCSHRCFRIGWYGLPAKKRKRM